MNAPGDSKRFGLYFHAPFCAAKCPYCDFFSLPIDSLGAAKVDKIVRALEGEIALAIERHPSLAGRSLDTIYFGGGTPSLLEPDVIARLIARAQEAFAPRDEAGGGWVETTLECNPRTAGAERLAAFRRAGVNRVSLGAQSFDDRALRRLGRRHDAEEARRACRAAAGAGFRSWGLDLIYGLPIGGEIERWRRDLEEAVALEPPHVSVYGLTLHEGTPLHAEWRAGGFKKADEEEERQMYLMARRSLIEAGLRHYEISNYARPGHESRHNSLYWTGGEYLGLGPGAHSYFDDIRRANPSSIEKYLAGAEARRYLARAEDTPSERSLRGERVMLALRQCEGVSFEALDRALGCDFRTVYAGEIGRLQDAGLLERSESRARLTEEGLLLSDTVFEEFF